MQFKTFALLVFLSACQKVHSAQNQKEKWVEPNAWGSEIEVKSLHAATLENVCMCNAEGSPGFSDNQVAIFLLKKFIKYLFSREKLEYDDHFSVYQRELLFTVLPAQLEKLEHFSDPRDVDNVLSEIFGNVHSPDKYNKSNGTWFSIFALIWDILKDLVMLLRFSEVQFIVFVMSFIMIAWFIHRRHNVGIIVVIVSGFLVFGYIVTYLECNRELELKQMLEVIEKNEATKTGEPNWYSPLTRWFGSSNDDVVRTKRREEIKKASKLNLAFCRPDHVLMLYGNELFLKQLEFLIEKCTTTLSALQDSLTFPFNYIAAVGLLCMIGYMVKLTFKYILSPRVWTGYFNNSRSQRQHAEALTHHEDRLSGENLKAILSAIKRPNVFINNSNIPTVSCVQELPAEKFKKIQQSDNSCNSCSSDEYDSSTSDTFLSKTKKSLPYNLTEKSGSVEIVETELQMLSKESDKSEADFVLISQVKSKATTADLPED